MRVPLPAGAKATSLLHWTVVRPQRSHALALIVTAPRSGRSETE